jgi:hypothetical protein
VLASLGEDGDLPLYMINHRGLACFKHCFTLVQVRQSGLNRCPPIGELAPLLRGFALDFIL